MATGTLSQVSNFLFINEQTDEPPNRRNRIHHVSGLAGRRDSRSHATVAYAAVAQWHSHMVR